MLRCLLPAAFDRCSRCRCALRWQLGEVANPARLWAQVLAVQLQSQRLTAAPPGLVQGRTRRDALPLPSQLPRSSLPLILFHATLSSVHLLLFAATRAVCLLYFVLAVWPSAKSGLTVLSAVAMLLFSASTLAVFAWSSEGVLLATTTPERKQL